jgi:hypothetical protein
MRTIHRETVMWDFQAGILIEGAPPSGGGGGGGGGGSGSQPRVVEQVDAPTVTIDPATTDVAVLLTVSQATFFANPSSTPNSEQPLRIRITSASPQLLTWGTMFHAGTDLAPLPGTTSGGGLTDRYGFIWNDMNNVFDYVAIAGGL